MRCLSLPELLRLHLRIIEQSDGALGVRDLGMIESALAQPRMTFDGADLYPTIIEKASALAFSLIKNHPFIDGNKRTSLLAIYTFLGINGVDFIVPEAEAAAVIMSLAAGQISAENLARWIRNKWPKV